MFFVVGLVLGDAILCIPLLRAAHFLVYRFSGKPTNVYTIDQGGARVCRPLLLREIHELVHHYLAQPTKLLGSLKHSDTVPQSWPRDIYGPGR